MSVFPKSKARFTTNPQEAAYLLAAILGYELRVRIDSDALHDLILREWSVISHLAHTIHGQSLGSGPMGGIDATET